MGAFNRRFYLAKSLSGLLISVAVVLGLFFLFAVLEHYLRFGSVPRAILFYGFTLVSVGLVIIQVIIPLFKAMGIVEDRSQDDTARAIQRTLPEVEDRLVNVLNLEERSAQEASPLLTAGLEKNAMELNRFHFAESIDMRASWVWAKYTIIPVFALFLISLWNPAIITDSADRIINYNRHFAPPAPFTFAFDAQEFNVPEGEAFTLNVGVDGDAVPENCFVLFDGKEMRMKQQGAASFSYVFPQVRKGFTLKVRGANVLSQPVEVKVLPQPKLVRSEGIISYPAYTGLEDEKVLNRSSYAIPEGTNVRWLISHVNAAQVNVRIGVEQVKTVTEAGGTAFQERFLDNRQITLMLSSDQGLADSATIEVGVIKDAFPLIEVDQALDSLSGSYFFRGDIKDDYGFTDLSFVVEKDGGVLLKGNIELAKGLREQRFNHAWQPDSLMKYEGATLSYYFSVADNDGVNGAKRTQSRVFDFKVPSLEEIRAQADQQANKTKQSLDDDQKELKALNKELDEIKKELLEKRKPDWEEQERLKALLKQQQQMMEKLEQRIQEQERFQEQAEQMNPYSEELLQKQQMIQEMFEKLFDEEFKEKYEEYQKLLEEMNKEQMLERIDEMKLDNETLEKELDRTLELFKELEFEQKLEENIRRADELTKEQEELKERTDKKAEDVQDLKGDQEGLQDKLDDLEESLEEMDALNDALENPKEMPALEQEIKDAEEAMQQASDQLEKGNEKKAGQEQEKASEAMKQMSEKMSQFQAQQSASQQSENLDDMRQLMENIVDLSVEQESIMEGVKGVQPNDPKYVEFAKGQKKIIDDTKVVEDSLLALSKRVPQIDRVINDEITTVKFSMERGLNYMTNQPPNQERKYVAMAAERQQYAMTSLNNLALLFDEIMDQMQQEMKPGMSGSGECKKPGSGKGQKPSAAEMRKMQESLNKQLQQLKDAKEKGKNPNGKKPGESGGGGMGGMSKDMARMAAQQAALRQQLRQMSESLNGEKGGTAGDRMREMEELMEQTEEDILFDQVSAETMRRQQEIITKLLESEKAEREQELDKEREAQSNVRNFRIPDEVWEKFKEEKEKEVELYQTVPPNLKPFYRKEVNRYFSTIPTGDDGENR